MVVLLKIRAVDFGIEEKLGKLSLPSFLSRFALEHLGLAT
jgi:hypothetical protein